METLELPHRAATALGNCADRTLAFVGALSPEPRLRSEPPASWLSLATPTLDAAPYLREADALAAGRLQRLDGSTLDLGALPDWSRTEPRADQPTPGDVRHAMEMHRHGHLVRLAQAWRLNGDQRHLAALLRQLDAWLDQCPYPQGVAWASALDVALRLINWSIVWQLIDGHRAGGALPHPLRKRWVASVYQHARFVRQNKSRYSSANNHLLGELMGLVVAQATWPLWPEVVRWGAAARRAVYVEAILQVHPDGVGCEQASWYQGFVFELLALFVHIEQAQGHVVDDRVLRRMGAMARFAASLRDRNGRVSHHGDADGAHALALGFQADDATDRVLTLAVAMGIAPELRPLIQHPCDSAAWLLGQNDDAASTDTDGDRATTRALLPRAFPEGGYYLLGSRFGEADEVMLTVDAGPLGYLGIAAHGHADALSLRLSVAGHPLLVDRGTCVYNTEPAWRHFFRSTLAHNTVCVDGADQSEYGGPFLWLRKARCQVSSFVSVDGAGHLDAMHDGYRSAHGLIHRRRVDWLGASRHFIVTDTLSGNGPHAIAMAWHFDPQCRVELRGDTVHVRSGPVTLQLVPQHSPVKGHWTLHHGATDSMLGWHSPAFGVRVAAPTLVWHAAIHGPTTFVTRIDIQTIEEDTRETKNSGL